MDSVKGNLRQRDAAVLLRPGVAKRTGREHNHALPACHNHMLFKQPTSNAIRSRFAEARQPVHGTGENLAKGPVI